MSITKPKRGRPPKPPHERIHNPQRWVGRWPADQWRHVEIAASILDLSVADFARRFLLPIAQHIAKHGPGWEGHDNADPIDKIEQQQIAALKAHAEATQSTKPSATSTPDEEL